MKILSVILLLGLISAIYSANWAVLVAGSDGYWNYRHQADTCHAYQILIKGGVKPENIIHFAKDDIANNERNPIKDTLYNKPDPTGEGVNVYKNCKIDYSGSLVTPDNFLSVIQGTSTTTLTKVLKSKENDNVFFYFSDHGAPQLIAFPTAFLYKKDLWAAIKNMKTKKMYSKLTFYIEAGESGSMCNDDSFTEGTDVYCLTATTATEVNHATYCGDDAKVNGKIINACLSNAFSANWMENTDSNQRTETLEQQFTAVKALTKVSTVSQWLNKAYTSDTIGSFIGSTSTHQTNSFEEYNKNYDDNRLAKLSFLRREMEFNPNDKAKEVAYATELHLHNFVAKIIKDLGKLHNKKYEDMEDSLPEFDSDCYQTLIETFERNCQKLPEHSLPYLKVFAHICSDHAKLNKTIFSLLLQRVCVPEVQ